MTHVFHCVDLDILNHFLHCTMEPGVGRPFCIFRKYGVEVYSIMNHGAMSDALCSCN